MWIYFSFTLVLAIFNCQTKSVVVLGAAFHLHFHLHLQDVTKLDVIVGIHNTSQLTSHKAISAVCG